MDKTDKIIGSTFVGAGIIFISNIFINDTLYLWKHGDPHGLGKVGLHDIMFSGFILSLLILILIGIIKEN